MPWRETMAMKPDVMTVTMFGIRTELGCQPISAATLRDIEDTHTLCFSDEVMEHQFLEWFTPINIKPYDGMTDPAVWMEYFLLHIHVARGDDLHAIKYLPLKLKGPAWH